MFCGADFKALEAVVGALLPKDPAKLKVYTEGYDSHCLNTFAYFPDQLPDIVDTVESINSIQDKYPELRGSSKPKTFALQYFGTIGTLMNRGGLSKALATQVYNNYHKLYKVSDDWIDDILNKAHATGYIEGAFGLKVRTPILARTPVNLKKKPYMAEAERRSAGNAKTQSYGLLNNRAAIEFSEQVAVSPYRDDILISSLIHDAIYCLCRNKPAVVKWANDNLVECMRWQELPELQHDIVKLGAELDLYWPAWKDALTLPNDIDIDEIKQRAKAHKDKILEAV